MLSAGKQRVAAGRNSGCSSPDGPRASATRAHLEETSMARYISWALAAFLVVPAAGYAVELCDRSAADAQGQRGARGEEPGKDSRSGPPRPKPWWIDEGDRAELGITDQQSASIEQVWQKSLPKLREARDKLDNLEAVLSQMILDASDEATVVAQIERVENARSEANKARTLMLYRMNRLLTADQRVKVKAMHDRREASRRPPPKDAHDRRER